MRAGARLDAIADNVAQVPRAALVATGKRAADVAAVELRRAGVETLHLPRRGKPDRAVQLRVAATITTKAGVDRLRIQGVPVGPWVWVNTGTRPHLVGVANVQGSNAAAARLARRGRHRVLLSFGGDSIATGPIAHPGMSHRLYVWRRVAQALADDSPDVVRDAVHQAVIRG